MAQRGLSGEESYWIPDASVLAATSPGMEDFEDLSSWIQNQKCRNRSDRCLGLNLSQFQLHTSGKYIQAQRRFINSNSENDDDDDDDDDDDVFSLFTLTRSN